MAKAIVDKLLRNRLFVRMLLYYLSLLLPILVVGLFFYHNSIEKMKNDFADKIELNLAASVNTIDTLMSSAQETSRSFFYDNTVRSLLLPYRLYNNDERSRITLIPQALSSVASINSSIVESVFVYVDESKVYTTGGLDDFSFFFEKTLKYDEYDQHYWQQLLTVSRSMNILRPTEVTLQYGRRVPVIPLVLNDSIRGYNVVMVLNLSVNAVNRLLSGNSIFAASNFVVLDHNGNVVVNMLSAEEGALLDEIRRIADDGNSGGGEQGIRLEAGPYLLTRASSGLYGWQYFSLTPTAEFTGQAREMLKLIFTICLILLLIGIVMSVTFTFNLYSPIRKISNILTGKAGMFPEADNRLDRNELDLIGRGVVELIRFTDAYKNRLNAMSLEYLDASVINLLRGNSVKDVGKLEDTFAENFQMKEGQYLVCCLRLQYKPLFYEEMKAADVGLIQEKVGRMIGGLLNEFVQVYRVDLKHGLIALLVRVREGKDKEQLIKGLGNLFDVFRYDSQFCAIHAGVGRPCASLKQIHQSFGEAMTAVLYCEAEAPFQYVDIADIEANNSFFYSFVDENKLINSLKTADRDSLKRVVEDIFRYNASRKVSYNCLRMLLSEMFNSGQRTAAEMGLNSREILERGQEWLEQIGSMDLEEKKEKLLAFFQLMIDKIAAYQDNKSGEWAASIIRYIEDHYSEELYLEKIADNMKLSAKHVSRLFKETTGMNVTDYISKYRIGKAKELMRNTDMSISQISEQVGLFSRTTFIRLFKKFEGVAPNEFRKVAEKE